MAALLLVALALAAQACFAVDIPSVTLSNAAVPGTKMPVTGIGTGGFISSPSSQPGEWWTDDVAEKAIGQWLSLGGRRIDESYTYRNQIGVGKAIKASGIPREQLFVVSKVVNNGYNDTLTQMKPILDTLQVDYVDLLLVHWPTKRQDSSDPACRGNDSTSYRGCRQSTWKAMEEIYKNGQARAIGVSNFEQNHLEDILALKSLIPAVNQVEFHPYWHEEELVAFCKSYNITFNGYSPLGAPDWAPTQRHWSHTIMQEPVIMKIAQAYSRTPAQIILRWEWQQDVLVQPRTMNPEHMKENLSFFDFELSDTEMKEISSISPPPEPKVCSDPRQIK